MFAMYVNTHHGLSYSNLKLSILSSTHCESIFTFDLVEGFWNKGLHLFILEGGEGVSRLNNSRLNKCNFYFTTLNCNCCTGYKYPTGFHTGCFIWVGIHVQAVYIDKPQKGRWCKHILLYRVWCREITISISRAVLYIQFKIFPTWGGGGGGDGNKLLEGISSLPTPPFPLWNTVLGKRPLPGECPCT